MTRFETSPIDTARQAFDSLDVPRDDTDRTLVRVLWDREPGREGYLNRELLGLKVFDVDKNRDPHSPDGGDREVRAFLERWRDNIHLMGILGHHLNPEGRRFTLVTDVMWELTRQAVTGNNASAVATQLDIQANPDTPPVQTTFSIWDNGAPTDSEGLRTRYLQDGYYDFRDGTWKQGERDGHDRWPTLAIRSVMGARGLVTLASGSHALDLQPADNGHDTLFTLEDREIRLINGNAVVVRLPHVG